MTPDATVVWLQSGGIRHAFVIRGGTEKDPTPFSMEVACKMPLKAAVKGMQGSAYHAVRPGCIPCLGATRATPRGVLTEFVEELKSK